MKMEIPIRDVKLLGGPSDGAVVRGQMFHETVFVMIGDERQVFGPKDVFKVTEPARYAVYALDHEVTLGSDEYDADATDHEPAVHAAVYRFNKVGSFFDQTMESAD